MMDTTTLAGATDPLATGSTSPAPLLKAERIQAALRDLPGWSLAADETALERAYDCTSVDAALTFLCYALTTTYDRGQTVRAVLEGFRVVLRLSTPTAGGVTEADLDLAHQIDQR